MKKYFTLLFILFQLTAYAQIPFAGLVGYYPLNGNANDSSGNGFNGTIFGPTPDTGICSPAYLFDNDYIDCGNPAGGQFDLNGNASICLWFKLKGNANSTGAGFPVLGKDVSGGTFPKWFLSVFGDSIAFHINDYGQGSGHWIYSNYYHFGIDTFYHMVITKSGNNYEFFINANPWGMKTQPINTPTIPHSMQIGMNEAISTDVVVDQVLIYNKVLTQAEIDSIYHNPCSIINVKAGFIANDTTPCSGNCITFNNTSTGATSYQWSFPGATIPGSTSASPGNVCYDTSGQYNVRLIVSNGSVNDTLLKSLYITVNPSPNAGLVSGNPLSFCSGGTAQLNDSGSVGNIQWQSSVNGSTFNDISGAQSSAYTAANLTQTSWYRVQSQSGSCGTDTSSSVMITVIPASIAGTITSDKDTLCAGTLADLTDNGLSGSPIQWQSSDTTGNFVDINSANDTTYTTQPLLQTTYYRVVIGNGSCMAVSDSIRLYVPPSLIADFNFTINGTSVTFSSNPSQGNIVVYEWTFGDGTASNTQNPAHVYGKPDTTYNVCLSVYDGSNCSYTYCKDVMLETGIANIDAQIMWTIYPDPFSDHLIINGKELNNKIECVKIYDVLGRIVINKTFGVTDNNPIIIDASGLAQGMYYLEIKTNEVNYIQKIVKQ